MQTQVAVSPSPVSEEEKDKHAPNERYNLESAFIVIDGKRYAAIDLFKLVVDKLSGAETKTDQRD